MVRAVVPRYRYDQLMRLGWKVFLPTSLAAVVLIAAWRVFGPQSCGYRRYDLLSAHRPGHQGRRPDGFRRGLRPGHEILWPAQEDHLLPLREGPLIAAFSWGARPAPLSQRRGALHRLQAHLRGHLARPSPSRPNPRRRRPARDPLRHRHGRYIYCGLCQEACPVDAIVEGPNLEFAVETARSSTTTRRGCWIAATTAGEREIAKRSGTGCAVSLTRRDSAAPGL